VTALPVVVTQIVRLRALARSGIEPRPAVDDAPVGNHTATTAGVPAAQRLDD
jgi:hypothetical protein